jgi:GNAT superfamily N-acetyltransferase
MTRPAIRPARPGDAETLASIHVAAWRETYPGLLPEAEIARHDLPYRLRQWQAMLGRGDTRIALAGDLGFAQMGPQRDSALAEEWPEELFAIYLLRAAQGTGLGRALLEAVAGETPFTAFVLDGNARAMAFYRKTGAEILGRTPLEDGWPDDILIGWRRIVQHR